MQVDVLGRSLGEGTAECAGGDHELSLEKEEETEKEDLADDSKDPAARGRALGRLQRHCPPPT